ncbi:cellulose synthase catalytic subunit, partial [Pleurocapsales cyanobacterium LEGE 10410]|nr:cellulose synthase catalytic subunit [Pleurocapsales cyanobacterium LEGE 10410]
VLILSGRITRSRDQDGLLKARVKFQNVSIEQHRELVEMLYCRPGRWQRRNTPNEIQSAVILLKLLSRPLMFLNAKKVKQLVQY